MPVDDDYFFARPDPKSIAHDADGFFDYACVKALVDHEYCAVRKLDKFALEVTSIVGGAGKPAILVAIDHDRWEGCAILKACTEACGRKTYDVDVAKARPENFDGLDELKIARVLGAIGIRPYLVRPSKYGCDEDRGYIVRPFTRGWAASGYTPMGDFENIRYAPPGDMTWPLLSVMAYDPGGASRDAIRGWRALELLGMLTFIPADVVKGWGIPRKIIWHPLAYLPKRPEPIALDAEDEAALEAMAM
jgi:hypothetical protein